jgi:hypothetical protein
MPSKGKYYPHVITCTPVLTFTDFRERYRLTLGQADFIMDEYTHWTIGKRSRLIFSTRQPADTLFLEQGSLEDRAQTLVDWYRELVTPPRR